MTRKIYLIGGAVVEEGESKAIDKKAIKETDKKIICILDLTTNDEEKKAKYRKFLSKYFKELGAEEILFDSTSKDIKHLIKNAGILYIPGGDTELLMKNLKEKDLIKEIRTFDSNIVGNSAGALILGKEAILFPDRHHSDFKIIKGIGLIDFSIDVHYENLHDKKLLELSKERKIYAIPEKCVIIFDGNLNFIGDIYEFSEGSKKKIN